MATVLDLSRFWLFSETTRVKSNFATNIGHLSLAPETEEYVRAHGHDTAQLHIALFAPCLVDVSKGGFFKVPGHPFCAYSREFQPRVG